MSRPPRMPFYGPPPSSTGFYRGGPQFPTPRRRPAMLSSAPYALATPDGRNAPQRGGPSIFLPNLPPFLPLGSRPYPTGAIIRVPGMPPMVAGEPIPLEPGEPLPPYMRPPMNPATAAQQAVSEQQQPALIILPTSGCSSAPTVVPIPIPMPMPMPIPSPAPAGSSSRGPIVIAPQGPSYPPPPPPLPPPPQPPPPPQQQLPASVPEVMAIMAMMRQFSTMDGAYDDDDSSEEDRESAKRRKDKKKEKKEKKKRKKARAKERARREKARNQEMQKKQGEAAKRKRPQQQKSRRKTIAEAGFNQDFT